MEWVKITDEGTCISRVSSSSVLAEIHCLDGAYEARVTITFLKRRWTSVIGGFNKEYPAQEEAAMLVEIYVDFIGNVISL